MYLARVVGKVVSTQKHPGLNGYKLLMVQPLDQQRKESGGMMVAADVVGAGVGELVLVALGSQVRHALRSDESAPIDAAVVGIVDFAEEGE